MPQGKILIIDDQEKNRQICEMNLQMEGYTTYTAENGKTGLEKILEVAPDLIILDIMMPEMDGYGVLDALARKESLSRIPVLMLTAKTQTDDLVRTMEMGAKDFLRKPFKIDELIARCNTLVRLKQAEDKLLDRGEFLEFTLKGITHDLNNVFTSLLLQESLNLRMERIQNSLSAEEFSKIEKDWNWLKRKLSHIRDNMGIGADIVQNGLKLALFGGMEKKTQNIRGILFTVAEMLKRKMEQYQIKFKLFLEDPLPDLFCNASDIYRIISNLMINAIQAVAEENGPVIELSAGREQENLVIRVRDNGPGMSEAVIKKLFKLHFTTKEQGSGIGLSVVKKIVLDHQGTIQVESSPGGGTGFILSFPL